MEEKNAAFTYAYSAKEREEIRKIRDKYAPPAKEDTPMDRLRRLDGSATRGATVVSLIVGILSALIMGVGMCCTMVWGGKLFIPGIVVGIAGIASALSSYPIYTHMVKSKRARLAPEILRLSDELMK